MDDVRKEFEKGRSMEGLRFRPRFNDYDIINDDFSPFRAIAISHEWQMFEKLYPEIDTLKAELASVTEDRDLWHETEQACGKQYTILLDESEALKTENERLQKYAPAKDYEPNLDRGGLSVLIQACNIAMNHCGATPDDLKIIGAKWDKIKAVIDEKPTKEEGCKFCAIDPAGHHSVNCPDYFKAHAQLNKE